MLETGPRAPRWAWWVATGLGSGRIKPAPGTWGSLGLWAEDDEVWCRRRFLVVDVPIGASLTVRCGTCYRCFNCGNSMGCS